jgi:dephospho-CoA kinase
VIAPKDMRIARVLERDSQRTIQNVEDIISKQSSDEEKISKSEFVIVNDNKSLVIPQVLDVHSALINLNQTG